VKAAGVGLEPQQMVAVISLLAKIPVHPLLAHWYSVYKKVRRKKIPPSVKMITSGNSVQINLIYNHKTQIKYMK
jgi:hypothetical protein